MRDIETPRAFQGLYIPARYKGFYSGRGCAKSHSFAGALLTVGYDRPLRILCAREIQKSIKDSVKKLLDDKIAAYDLGGFYYSTDTQIRGANGTEFIFAGLRTNIDSIKSLEAIDICWVEEASSISKDSLDKLIPTIRKEGAELWFSWNPNLPTDPVDVMFRGPQGPPPGAIVRRVTYRDNPWFTKTLRDEMELAKARDLDKYLHVWCGEYLRNSEARIFKNWRVGSYADFTPKARTRFYYGADFGFSMDPSVMVRSYIEGRNLFIDREAWELGCEIDYLPFLFGGFDDPELINLNPDAYNKLRLVGLPPKWPSMLPKWPGIPGARRWPSRADSARPDTIQFLRRHGFPLVQPAKKGANSIADGIEFIRTFDVLIHPDCTHVQDEFTHYSWKTDPLTGQILPIPEDAKNHTIDSIRYELEDARGPTMTQATIKGF